MGLAQTLILFILIFCFNFGRAGEVEPIYVYGQRPIPNPDQFQLDPATADEQQDLGRLLTSLPNLEFASGSNRPRFFQIRGVGESSQFEHSQVNAVGFFYEGIDLSEEASTLPLFGRETMRVNYGPQVTEWGGKALAGSVEVSSCLTDDGPTQRWQGSLGSFGTRSFSGGSLWKGEQTSVILNAGLTNSNGYINNKYLSRPTAFQDDRDFTFGVAYRFGPLHVRQHHILAIRHDGYDGWSFTPSFETLSDHPGRDDHQVHGHSVQWDTRLGDFSLHGLSSLTVTQQIESYDEDWANNAYWNQIPGWNQPYNYFAEFERQRTKFHQKLFLTDHSGGEIGLHYSRFQENQVIRSYNDEVIRKISEPKLTSETFALWIRKKWQFENWFLQMAERTEGQAVRLQGIADSQGRTLPPDFGLEAKLQRQWTPDLSSELGLRRGFRGGGYNTSPELTRDRLAYDSEQLYLAQFSTQLVQRDLSVMVRLFFQRRVREQARSSYQQDPTDPNAFTYYTANVDGSQSYGLESTASQTWKRWTLSGSAGLMHSRYNSYSLGGHDLSGRQVAHAPPWTYQTRLAFAPQPFSTYAQVTGRDSYYHSADHDFKSKPYHLVDVGGAVDLGNWQLQVWIKNLFNQNYAVRAFYFANEPPDWQEKYYVQWGAPRTYGMQATYSIPE